jgi:cytochrome c
MPSIDALADAYYADRDPQFQDQDAYDVDEYLDTVGKAKEQIDDTLSTIENALDIRYTKGLEKAKKLLTEAFNRLEEES